MYELHVFGGVAFMAPITLVLLVNIGLFVVSLIQWLRTHRLNSFLVESVRQLGLLVLAYGAFGTVYSLMFAFGDLARMSETLPVNVIMGGLEASVINVVYGFIAFLISFTGFLVLRFLSRKHQPG